MSTAQQQDDTFKTMYLSTIESAPTRSTRQFRGLVDYLSTKDIKGAQPYTTPECAIIKLSKSKSTTHHNEDIKGSTPLVLIPKSNHFS
jgi:hypothetical protein